MDFLEYFASPVAFVPLIILASEFAQKKWELHGTAAWVRSVVITLILCAATWFLNVGFMADLSIIDAGLNTAGILAVSNGLFSWPVVKWFLEVVKIRAKS